MNSNQYINYIHNGDFKYHITQLLPFIFWVFFSLELFYFYRKSKYLNNKLISSIFFIIWCLPFLFAISNVTSNNTSDKNNKVKKHNINLPPGVGYCFNSDIKSDDKNKGIVSYVDYKCLSNNKKFIRSSAKNLLNRSYYINYSIFLIVILAFNTITKFNIFQNKFILLNIRYALFFGTLACLFTVFSPGFYLKSLWVNQLWSYIVSMNTSCFMFIGVTILMIVNNIKIF